MVVTSSIHFEIEYCLAEHDGTVPHQRLGIVLLTELRTQLEWVGREPLNLNPRELNASLTIHFNQLIQTLSAEQAGKSNGRCHGKMLPRSLA